LFTQILQLVAEYLEIAFQVPIGISQVPHVIGNIVSLFLAF
jgi:hypothetical protein